MENSEILLQYALNAMKEAGLPDGVWSIGGGTVLAAFYNHRLSKDIDIFITDAQYLSALSPRFNMAIEDASDYLEMANFISLSFPEGKVDFITSGQLTDFSSHIKSFMGQLVPLDDPVEIVTKKIFYRSEQLLPRDIFDLAIVYNSDRKNDLVMAISELGDKAQSFIEKFEAREAEIVKELYSSVFSQNLLSGGLSIKGKEVEYCKKLILELKEEMKKTKLLEKHKSKKKNRGLSL